MMPLQADMPDYWSFDVQRCLQLLQSDDPDLKLHAAEIIRQRETASNCLNSNQLSGLIKLLVSMLQVDLPEYHCEFALQALSNLATAKKNNIKIVEVGALEPIISFLQSQSLNLLESATEILLLLSTDDINKPVIGSSGAIPLLVKILGHESQQVQMNAMKALSKLSTDSKNLKIILGTYPIPPIVNFLKNCDKSSKIAEMCSALIESLVGFDEGRTALTYEEGGMLAVVEVLEFGSPQSQEHASRVLLTMCQSNIRIYRELIHGETVISERLRLILKGTPKPQVNARILLWLYKDSSFPTIFGDLLDDPELKLQVTEEIRQFINACDISWGQFSGLIELSDLMEPLIKPLVSMLRVNSPESLHKSSLLLLSDLARINRENKINIVKAGVLEPIISFLESQCLNLQQYAAAILFTLSATTINKPVIGSSGAIPLLLKILTHGNPQAKIDAIGALLNLSKYSDNLNIILGTNPIPPIVNLLKTCKISSILVEKCSALIESLVGFDEGRTALTFEEGGVLAVIELLENGSLQSREHAVGVLLKMCQSDRCKYREPILREGIIPGLEKLTVRGTPKSKLKARILLLLLGDSPYSQRVPRVTLYKLNNNGQWVNGRICYVTIDYLKGTEELGLFVVDEEDNVISLLQRISPDDVYKRHEDTLISWRDPKYCRGLSLRFQEAIECSYIWDHICNVLNLHFNTLKTSLRRIGGSTREINDTNSNVSSHQKVTLEWIFVIANFILEIPSAAFDQLSSVQNPEYAQTAMVMAFVAIFVCLGELIYKGQNKRVMWRWRGRIPWFYYPPPSNKPFGTFADIVGLGCAIFQFFVTTVNYSFICRNVDGPIKISVWPIIFTFGVLCCKLSENPKKILHQD